ncbi:MAG: carbamoyl-phosphate synthase large subunit [Burkholderiales bacterium]
MPKRTDISKIMVIGSGPIVIGQAAEFDYSGTQACKALKEEGFEVVLINSNPATIMTDEEMADKVYIEPITLEVVSSILRAERPQGIIATLGGQTGLNMAVELAQSGILDELNIELLGTPLESIRLAEDRELFKKTMESIGEKIAKSRIACSVDEAAAFADEVGFPIIVRPAYTLGGTGGGVARDINELKDITAKGLSFSIIGQVLLEQSVAGYKEIEYEVMRDANDNCIVVCNMENLDPVGIHTGDSIVVAPSQTLSDKEYQMLRSASIKIIRALKIRGGCNIQFALSPGSPEYVVIEVNPRVSRSSALASKATGYPIARAAAKIAVGFGLDEIANPITGETSACFEPALDYVVTKVPRWPFDKFVTATRTLGTQMKATGEVMAIGRNFEESLLKAIDSLDVKLDYQLGMKTIAQWTDEQIENSLRTPDDERIFVISEALERGYSVEEICSITKIDKFFVSKLENIVSLAKQLKAHTANTLPQELLYKCKRFGFGDSYIANLIGTDEHSIKALRVKWDMRPAYKMVDTCAGEFEAKTPYYYSCYDSGDESKDSGRKKVVVLGSGPIRIGQGIEFDYCSVHSALALKALGYESIIINSNPETVSTDFDTSDKLYFEPLTKECVLDIIEREKPEGVIVQFGGQTAINLAAPLAQEGVNILGTPVDGIDRAEDRERFLEALVKLDIPIPPGATAFSQNDAREIAARIGYPVLVRPSYVLGGRAMEIVYDEQELKEYMTYAAKVSPKHPVLVDKYINGKEVEIDGICDGSDALIVGIMEHIERAGVHSGDSFAVYPTQTLAPETKRTIVDYAMRIGIELGIKGLYNIQFVIDREGGVYVLEVNPRASRTVPILSKVTGVPMVRLATRIMMGEALIGMGYGTGFYKENKLVTVKAPVFSFSKLTTVDIFLGPEMKSTGEVMGTDTTFLAALKKAFAASGIRPPQTGKPVLFSITDRDKHEASECARQMIDLGFSVACTDSTYESFSDLGVKCSLISKRNVIKALKNREVSMVINTPTRGKQQARLGFVLRRTAMEFNIPCITSMDTLKALLSVMSAEHIEEHYIPLGGYKK